MRLLSITPSSFGPFAARSELKFEPDVTVLTGANDTGKSSLLRLLYLILSWRSKEVEESDVNFDQLVTAAVKWDEHRNFGADLRVFASSPSRYFTNTADTGPNSGDTLDVTFNLSTNSKAATVKRLTRSNGNADIAIGPFNTDLRIDQFEVVYLPQQEEQIRNPIDATNANVFERKLLEAAFGPQFNADALSKVSAIVFASTVQRANQQLNKVIESVLPSSLPITLSLMQYQNSQTTFVVQAIDRHNGYVPLGWRGTGVRKLIALITRLAAVGRSDIPVFVLYDEPETSLHADSQHRFRFTLEELGQRPNVQIVYSTHSPCMINSMRPETVRLLSRKMDCETATSVIDNFPIHQNFRSVRSSLDHLNQESRCDCVKFHAASLASLQQR